MRRTSKHVKPQKMIANGGNDASNTVLTGHLENKIVKTTFFSKSANKKSVFMSWPSNLIHGRFSPVGVGVHGTHCAGKSVPTFNAGEAFPLHEWQGLNFASCVLWGFPQEKIRLSSSVNKIPFTHINMKEKPRPCKNQRCLLHALSSVSLSQNRWWVPTAK